MERVIKQVKDAAKRAEDAHKAAYPEPESEETSAEPEPKLAVVADPEPESVENSEETPAPEAKEEKPVDWEQKFRSLQGIVDRELKPAQRRANEAEAEVKGLRNILASVQTPEPERVVEKEERAKVSSLLTKEEVDEYGPEFIDIIHRAGREIWEPEVKRMQEEIEKLQGQLGGVTETVNTSQTKSVFDVLTAKLPNWREINEDPLFLDWLDQSDPYSGVPRLQLVRNAFDNHDAERVIRFFEGYLKENEAMQQGHAQPSQARQPAKKLDNLVAPGRPKEQVAPTQQGNERLWSRAQIAAFYRDVTKGKYDNKPKERAKIEADIIAATTSNRLTS